MTCLDVRRRLGSYLLLAQNLKVASSQVQMAWPGRARMGYRAPQRAVQVSGGAERPTNASATQRDEFWNSLCCAVRRRHQMPECTRAPSNWKNGVYQCNGTKLSSILDIHIELEHALVAIWAIWPPLSAPMAIQGKINHHIHSSGVRM